MFVNWLILDGQLFVTSKGEKPTVGPVIMWRHRFYKAMSMIKLLICGALVFSPTS